MSSIELNGLRGDLPIGAMAAFGVLRVVSRCDGISAPKLSWTGGEGDYRAVLTIENGVTADDLVSVLIADVRRDLQLPEWDQVKTCTEKNFRSAALEAANSATPEDYEPADWLAALANELAITREGNVEATPFDMSVARQKFLADARRLAAGLRDEQRQESAVQAYKEAVFGPWRYKDDQHSLGWDPTTMKLGAFTHKAPTGMANSGVRAAVWLAFESLPLFPCFYRGRSQTRGFVQLDREATLVWPIWRNPVSPRELGTLLGWADLNAKDQDREELEARGIRAIYHSERVKPNQYMKTFRPSELMYAAG